MTNTTSVTDQLFLLDLKLFSKLCKKVLMNTAKVFIALPQIPSLIQMRQMMGFVVIMINRECIQISDALSPYTVTTMELKWNHAK